MPEHQHSLDGKNRDLTIGDLKEFVETAGKCGAADKRTVYVETSGRKIRKIWIDLSSPN
ncbi:hypothetical protein ACWEWG_38810 [Streptomyces sp. NPDC003758]|jgi:hypothetical protein|uniref:Uncharacterized protein n=1 Tax=Streptomyces cynarae TaxID=2981134 RepID=A0ABY6EAN6_9ACTN|nr:hypothetical protein [Streptomyces cynarae]UXY23719.1 hypothetical protein N8I84_37285 [Streptomyces cynarae]